ncbi:uncharacterized protein [Ptychodera flava]|uniref:uncharacterized protein n=1 Tax=Ptychodera flava TaxID=63121 RepID=UPI00396A1F31
MGFDLFLILMLISSCRYTIAQITTPAPYAQLTVTSFDIVFGSNVVYSVSQAPTITFDIHVDISYAVDAIVTKVEVYLTDYDVSGCYGTCYSKHIARASKPPVGTELHLSPSSTNVIEDVTATVRIDTTDESVNCEDIKLICLLVTYQDGEYSAVQRRVCNQLSDGAVDCSSPTPAPTLAPDKGDEDSGSRDSGSAFITLTIAGFVIHYSLTI